MNHIHHLLLFSQLWAHMLTVFKVDVWRHSFNSPASGPVPIYWKECQPVHAGIFPAEITPNSQSWKDTYVSCERELTDGAWLTAQMWTAACVLDLENLPRFSQ